MRDFLAGVLDALRCPYVLVISGRPDACYLAGFGVGRRLRGVYKGGAR